MALVKRILAGIILVISALLLLASVVGLIGIWAVNTPLTNTLLDILGAADRTLQLGTQALGRTQSQLSAIQAQIDETQAKLSAVGTSPADNAQALEQLKRTARDTLDPQLQGASADIARLREGIVLAGQIMRALRSLPGVGIQAPADEPVESASKTATELAGLADQWSAQVAAVAELKRDTAASLQRTLETISGRVAALEQQLTAAEQSIASASSSIASAEASIPLWIDLVSVAISVVALVAVLAFASLCVQAWRVVSGRGGPAAAPQRELPAS
jgi:uncharacterized protein YlxW (UPF0749 family)